MPSCFPGPAALGRGAVLDLNGTVPSELADAPAFLIDDDALAEPGPLVEALHEHWLAREPYVVRLAVSPQQLKGLQQHSTTRPPWSVGAGFLFPAERLHFLVWANTWDLRADEPVWWWGRKAIALGATLADGDADVVLPDGTSAWCDGGPLQQLPTVDGQAVIHRTAIEARTLRPLRDGNADHIQLADDQRAAVVHTKGPARVIAPAGSGKTRVLTERVRHVLDDWGAHPSAVTVVAYNTRAAEELQQRTEGLGAHIRTLNSLGLAIVSGTGGFVRSHLEPSPRRTLDERDVRTILSSLVDVPRRANTDPLAPWIEALSIARLGLVDPSSIEAEIADVGGFAHTFDRYRAVLEERRVMDFDEQIYRAIEILLQDPAARRVAQQRCRMLLVDEFQDLTPAHVLLLRLLASPSLDVFGVGDDDQVIYGYAGASPQYLVDFPQWFPGAAAHALQVNYRCPPMVVAAASNLLTRNRVRIAKDIRTPTEKVGSSDDLRVQRCAAPDLAPAAVQALRSLLDADVPTSSIAVLARVNVALLPLQVALIEDGVPVSTAVNRELLNRTGIRSALAYLRMGLDPQDLQSADILQTVRRPSRRIARNVVEMMTKRGRTSIGDLSRLANALSGSDKDKVRDYVDDLRSISAAVSSGTTANALEVIREDIGLGRAMDVLDASRREADRSTHADDLAALTAVAHLHPDAGTFEPWLHSVLSTKSTPGGVHLSTIHRVKGREWDHVLVYDASDGVLPHRLSTDLAEERRVFHVAITRGRATVQVFGDAAAPSPFLSQIDAPGEPDPAPTPKVVGSPLRPSRSDRSKSPTAGPATVHAALGLSVSTGGFDGTIIDIREDDVLISPGGTAKLSVRFGQPVRVGDKDLVLAPPLDPATAALAEALRTWRAETARAAKLPAYTVLHDRHIEDIATARPGSLEALARCNGIGPAKLDKYGDEILAVIDASNAPTQPDITDDLSPTSPEG